MRKAGADYSASAFLFVKELYIAVVKTKWIDSIKRIDKCLQK